VERLVPLVHDALDDLTARRLRAAVTADAPPLAPLALVDDARRALSDGAPADRSDRVRFAAMASRVVRRVLAAHARRAATGRPADRAPARDEWALSTMALEDALAGLALLDPRLPRVVECRVFGGLTDAETAEALGVSGRTVHRDWRRARAWLALRLAE
jgi:RNA polymerase sigma factor (TIGR02999 family)